MQESIWDIPVIPTGLPLPEAERAFRTVLLNAAEAADPDAIRIITTKASKMASVLSSTYGATIGEDAAEQALTVWCDVMLSRYQSGHTPQTVVPQSKQDRGMLYGMIARKAAERARYFAKKHYAPRIFTNSTSDADNAIQHWSVLKIVLRAERYTWGRLAPLCTNCLIPFKPAEQGKPSEPAHSTGKVQDGTTQDGKSKWVKCPECQGQGRTFKKHIPYKAVDRFKGIDQVYLDQFRTLVPFVNRMVCACPKCVAMAILDSRRGAGGYALPSIRGYKLSATVNGGITDEMLNGGVIGAEREFWQEVRDRGTLHALDNVYGADMVDNLYDSYNPEKRQINRSTDKDGTVHKVGEVTRFRGIHWEQVAKAQGGLRGTIYKQVRKKGFEHFFVQGGTFGPKWLNVHVSPQQVYPVKGVEKDVLRPSPTEVENAYREWFALERTFPAKRPNLPKPSNLSHKVDSWTIWVDLLKMVYTEQIRSFCAYWCEVVETYPVADYMDEWDERGVWYMAAAKDACAALDHFQVKHLKRSHG